ncbi:hypothetical protein F8388_015781 [Cannabis sativa]|uniref:Pantoate--beta-alanine ligase n=1 Tax=Cannabis sativa TaxID=3483 RepID=A0A7J6FG60_CANSA|nr:hypothetical protein F8388_015781 [Cannabis sativa]
MGYLHQGHISLVREAQHHSDLIVVSIYVNPGQFSPTEDLSTYPSNFRGDIEQLMAIPGGVDVVFHPHNLYHYGPTNESVDSDGDKGLDRKGTGVVSCVEDSGFGHETWVRVENLEKGYVCVISLLGKLNRAQLEKVACLVDNEARLALDPQNKYRIQTKLHGHDISEKLSEVTENNPIIMGTKMIVQTKRGLSLSSRESSTIEINPDNYEATTLHQWYDS